MAKAEVKRKFDCSADAAYTILLDALSGKGQVVLKGISIKNSNASSRTIEAKGSVSMKSWGETIKINVLPINADSCEVEIISSSMAAIDYGKNKENAETFFNVLTKFTKSEKPIYSVDGDRGRHIDVFPDKCVITTKAGVASFITGNASDGEKTIYYVDCIGVQFKKSGALLGYLQLETASGIMNNKKNNFFNENSFTFAPATVSNEKMEEIYNYIKDKIEAIKRKKDTPTVVQTSSADELKKFKELLDMGVITQEEFDAKKKQLLGL